MTPKEITKIGKELFGEWGWQTKLAKTLSINPSTVRRWISGHTKINGHQKQH